MDTDTPLPLLGGLTPRQFMQRHWQRKPLLVRGAIPGLQPMLPRAGLFALAEREDVESRVIQQDTGRGTWSLRRGPFARRSLPPASRPGWTLLLQGMDLHLDAAHALMQQFRFVPQARLDDLMVSWASDGGGVGPHFDSYDVFLLQGHGKRLWRWGRQADLTLQPDVPLKILQQFEPEHEAVLEPGDMLYLPPRYAHDGIAQGECQTWSIGFRAPGRHELARELLQRLAEDVDDGADAMYRDPRQPAVAQAGAIPADLQAFAQDALQRALADPDGLPRALGEYLSEPKPSVWFDTGSAPPQPGQALVLDRRTRMLYDARHVYANGESWRAAGADARLLRRLADERRLEPRELARASEAARELLGRWCEDGWAHGVDA